MLKRMMAMVALGLALASGSAFAQLDCSIENNFSGAFTSSPGSYTVVVAPGQSGTLRAANCPGANSFNWSPGNAQTSQIDVTAPQSGTASYVLTGCDAASQTCGNSASITLQVSATTPDCTLSASPNPATSGQTVTFTATCNSNTASIGYVDLSGVARQSRAFTFTDVAPAVTSPTIRNVDYHGTGVTGAPGPSHTLPVTINPAPSVRPPSQCSLAADTNPVTLGSSTRLTASCAAGDPVTTYQFSGPAGVIQSGAGNFVVVTPTAAGNVQYSVVAANAGGQQSASVTVTVNAPPPSGCTLSATPNPIALGQSTTLTAQCTGGGAPTAYRFINPDGSAVAQQSPTLVVTPPAAGSATYGVIASNAGGASQQAQTAVVVNPASCTIAASTPNPVPRGASVTLTATCNNNPISYTWTTPAGPVAGASGPAITVNPTATTAYTVTANNGSTVFPVQASGQYTVVVAGATRIAAVAGATITGTPGSPVSRALQVQVSDAQGNAVGGESVTWSVVNPGTSPGTFASNPTLSNTQGIATNTFTYGSDAGGRTLRACLTALPTVCADFQVVAGASQISAVISAPLTGTPGKPLSSELVARVADGSGNPIAGSLVNWSVVNPGASPGTFASSQTGPTDAQGLTRNTFTLGNDAGPRTLRACLAALPTVCADYPVTVTAASGLSLVPGTPLVGTPGKPLPRPIQVRATSAQGLPVAGELVNWTVVNPTPGSGAFAATQTGPTDASGLTQDTFTMGTDAGGRTLRACLVSQPAVCVDVVVRSVAAALDAPTSKIMSPLAELAEASTLTQLSNVRFRLDQLRLRRNPSVIEALRVRVAGQSLPSWNALSSMGPKKGDTGGGAAADDPFERLGFFVNGELEMGRQSPTATSQGFDLRTNGLTAGVDYRLPSDNVIGVALGLMNAKTDLDAGGGGQGARGYSVSAYGSFTPMQGAYVDAIAHAGSNHYDTRRREISDAGAPLDYTASTRGDQYALAITAGADVSRGALTINPYARLDYIHATIDGFSESGDDGSIKVGDLNLKSTIVTLGGQVSYAVGTSWGVFMPNARLELQRRVQGDGRIVNAQLVADATVNSQVGLETVDRDYGNASVGFSVVLPRGVSGFVNYERLFGRQNYSDSKLTLGLRFEF